MSRRVARSTARTQQGVSLILVLIVLAVLLVGSAMLLRTTESATFIVGNTTFKESAVRSAELGINAAFSAVTALTSEDISQAPWYFATAQNTDASGMPANIDWNTVAQSTLGNNRVQWVVERMCNAPLPVSDVYSQCQVSQTQQTGSNRGGWGVAIQNDPVKYYRVTVRVTGPKATEQFIQSLVSR